MPKEPYSVTRDGRLIIRDIDAIRDVQGRVMDVLDAIPDEPPSDEPPPDEAVEPMPARRRGRRGKVA